MNAYTTIDDFKWAEIVPYLHEFVDDYDVDAIAREASDYDEQKGGFFLRSNLESDDDAFWELCEHHDAN